VLASSGNDDFLKTTNIYISKAVYDKIVKEKDFENENIMQIAQANLQNVLGVDSLSKLVRFFCNSIHVKVEYVNSSDELDISGLKKDEEFGEDFEDAVFIGEDGNIINDEIG